MPAALLIGAIVFAAASFGHLTRPVGFLASFWPANALLLGLMIRRSEFATPLSLSGAVAGYLLADFVGGTPPLLSLWLTVANLASLLAGHAFFRQADPEDQRLARPQSILLLLLVSLASAAVSAVVGAGGLVVFFGSSPAQALALYVASELAANLVVLPMVLTAPPIATLRARRLRPRAPDRDGMLRSLPLLALIVSLAVGTMVGGSGAVSVPIPAILWCALSYGLFPTAVLTFVMGVWQGTVLVSAIPPGTDAFIPAAVSHRLGLALVALGPIMVASINSARGALLAKLDHAANHDALTGVLSRGALLERGERALLRSRERREPLALLLLDVDHFKSVNDGHGHAAGDRALAALSAAIGAELRREDVFGRLGGEEFAIVMPGKAADAARATAEHLRQLCERTPVRNDAGEALAITVSIGLASEPLARDTLGTMLKRADDALYRAKAEGRNRVVTAAAAEPAPALGEAPAGRLISP
ncbi:diguanylate cyclase [Bosea sp. TWI1241]|uniref:GGDEF domain-containing protein n=1 Tax=Bosea sp. TWI1241 TaxID=3148904 RepID=UPI00320791FA